MGFGTFFIGYFLILNVAYFTYTDLLASLIMFMGAYKLSSVSKTFSKLAYSTLALSALGVYELFAVLLLIFSVDIMPVVLVAYVGIVRYVILAVISYLALLGIEELAREVDIKSLEEKSRKTKFSSPIAFLSLAILEIPAIGAVIPTKALAIISLILLFASFVVTIIALTAIYTAYMQICMPEELIPKEENETKKGFFSKMRERELEAGREYAKYKMSKTGKGKNNGK